MTTAEEILERFNKDIDQHTKKILEDLHPFIANVISYFFGWTDVSFNPIAGRSGKKLRPTLNLLVYEAISGAYMPALPMATALELLHNYSLIHDDIEDRDEERRGRPTVWKVWGDNIALDIGDILHALAFRSLSDLTAVPAEKVLELHKILANTSITLCEGQYLDLTFEEKVDVSHDMYLEMIDRKTAALIACSTYTGALLATEEHTLITAYKNFGRNLGLAFQIRDDYLNIWGDAKSIGKPQYSDLKKKKKTLPVTYTLATLRDEAHTRLMDIYGRNNEEMSDTEITYVLQRFEQVQAQDYTVELVNRYVTEALDWLEKTNLENRAQTQLRILASFLTGRNF